MEFYFVIISVFTRFRSDTDKKSQTLSLELIGADKNAGILDEI